MIKKWILHDDKVWFYKGYRSDWGAAGNIVRNIRYGYGDSFADKTLKDAIKIYNEEKRVYEIYVRNTR